MAAKETTTTDAGELEQLQDVVLESTAQFEGLRSLYVPTFVPKIVRRRICCFSLLASRILLCAWRRQVVYIVSIRCITSLMLPTRRYHSNANYKGCEQEDNRLGSLDCEILLADVKTMRALQCPIHDESLKDFRQKLLADALELVDKAEQVGDRHAQTHTHTRSNSYSFHFDLLKYLLPVVYRGQRTAFLWTSQMLPDPREDLRGPDV